MIINRNAENVSNDIDRISDKAEGMLFALSQISVSVGFFASYMFTQAMQQYIMTQNTVGYLPCLSFALPTSEKLCP